MKKKLKLKEQKKTNIFELLNPQNLRKEIDEYGYQFAIGRYAFLLIATTGAAIACGIFFSLEWYYIAAIAAI
ncbi:MAG: hypothetical protein RSF88_06150, partial [Lachnospiraceae bacterium]